MPMVKHLFSLLAMLVAGLLLFSPAPARGAEEAVAPVIPLPPDGVSWADRVIVLSITGTLIGSPVSELPDQVIQALERADREGAKRVVLEIDSPGGEVGICDTLSRRIFETKTPVTSLVVHKAVSGGAMIAVAASQLVMTRSARIGDIQPMPFGLGGSTEMDDRSAEKIEVDIRTIMKVFGENHGRSPAVLAAMVSRDIELYQVTLEGGEVVYLDAEEIQVREDNLAKGRDEVKMTATRLIKPRGKLLELTAQQALEYKIADQVVDSPADYYAGAGLEESELIRPLLVEGKFELGKLIPSLEDFGLPIWVLALLGVFLIVGVAGVITEFHAPGTGVPAAMGIIGFAGFFCILFTHDRGSPLGIGVFLVGLALLVVEIMILPGFGVSGVLGIAGILGGLFLAFTPDWSSDYMRQFMWLEVGSFALLLLAVIVATVLVIWLLAAYGDRLPFIKFFTLNQRLAGGRNPFPETLRESPPSANREKKLVGQQGHAESPLRPSGKVRLDSGELLDAVSDGGFLEAGTRLVVQSARTGRVVVIPPPSTVSDPPPVDKNP
ncbi:MAG: ATP-dependent Clp protease proteolytic subunit [Planctomycetota bacterium]|jgi:membrane-bound serine protease (ClpP class)|nr:ATP-dependent Clp protease proteolytic subunit [Planctomycetota bacterium]